MKKIVEIKKEKSLVHPTNEPLSTEELVYKLKNAEEGTFITGQEGMRDFEHWLQTKEKSSCIY